ncbi:hypothetical protein [Consotaella salsifontis]|uniref:hypothetical protein n=1 Tax=Consotaella salsifontis TaxID=1365950 RepID=UPI0013F5F953|nr:hypothetical protein [Consotaella salsifontis]
MVLTVESTGDDRKHRPLPKEKRAKRRAEKVASVNLAGLKCQRSASGGIALHLRHHALEAA